MTIDEMKNKISMELKSPVTQQGFEIICKHLVELEKENADLKRDNEDLIFIRNQNAKYMCEDKERLTKAREIIGELQGILDKDICKDCDGGLHCSECYVNHAITTAGTFLEEYKK